MLWVCISFPWLKIIQAAFDRDPGPNENTPDMPRRCSIGSGGIGPVAEFVLESCGDSYHPGARRAEFGAAYGARSSELGFFVFSTCWRSDCITVFFSSAKTGAGNAKSCERSALSMETLLRTPRF